MNSERECLIRQHVRGTYACALRRATELLRANPSIDAIHVVQSCLYRGYALYSTPTSLSCATITRAMI
jgi:hypothetical protein